MRVQFLMGWTCATLFIIALNLAKTKGWL